MRWKTGLVIAVGLAGAPAFATDTTSYRLAAHVPVLCRVRLYQQPVSDTDGSRIDKLVEYCNASGGYDVRLIYPTGTFKGTIVKVSGRAIVLDGTGNSVIDVASGPAIRTVDVVSIGHNDNSTLGVDYTIIPH